MTHEPSERRLDRDGASNTTDESTFLAQQRTYLAAERTLFAVIRTGMAIAAGGAVLVQLFGTNWPQWVRIPLVGAFLIVGYLLVIIGLNRYRGIAKRVRRQGGQRMEIVPALYMEILTIALGVAMTIAVALFILGVFE